MHAIVRHVRPFAICGTWLLAMVIPAAVQAQTVLNVTGTENRSAGGTRTHCEGTRCFVAKGQTLLVRVQGAGIAAATHVIDDSGSIVSSLTGWKASPNKVEVKIRATATGTRGEKTVTIQQRVGGSVIATWPMRVNVINPGQITGSSFQAPSDFFTQAEFTVTGNNMGNARLQVHNDTWPPRPTITRLSNTPTEVRFRATYPTLQSAPTLKFVLCDEAVTTFGCPPAWGTVTGQFKGPPSVTGITFSSPRNVGSVVSINFKLSTPARTGGERVWWTLSNATDFQAVAGSCPYTTSGNKNEFIVPAGNQTHTCQVRIVQAGGTGPVNRIASCWVVNPNKLEAPWHCEHSFTISQS
ncbi:MULTISPECIES: hypothetical protein [unclassified Cyanobium]|uniref:hypothetical protein n=1 Tax=unclassified Cyanobium TaxID=2627006 RepID=UPI0020CFA0CB|nr:MULTISPECIES: hypothetical protein [unclassified Cyanobium]MCP9860374.1 hypothetical protein [Cyanobium sp. Cruz-8H5]MCP9867642.1 hypothetical protein [Cyanobium sp. Cruz-8D1]